MFANEFQNDYHSFEEDKDIGNNKSKKKDKDKSKRGYLVVNPCTYSILNNREARIHFRMVRNPSMARTISA